MLLGARNARGHDGMVVNYLRTAASECGVAKIKLAIVIVQVDVNLAIIWWNAKIVNVWMMASRRCDQGGGRMHQ